MCGKYSASVKSVCVSPRIYASVDSVRSFFVSVYRYNARWSAPRGISGVRVGRLDSKPRRQGRRCWGAHACPRASPSSRVNRKVLQACLHAVIALKRSFTNILATGLRPLTHVHTRTPGTPRSLVTWAFGAPRPSPVPRQRHATPSSTPHTHAATHTPRCHQLLICACSGKHQG